MKNLKHLLIATSVLFSGFIFGASAQEDKSTDKYLEEATKRKEIEAKASQRVSDSHYKIAQKLYSDHVNSDKDVKKADLQKARQNLIDSLTYNKENKNARALLIKVESALGVPASKIDDLLKNKSQAHNAFNQQQEMEIKQSIQESKNLIGKKEYVKAQRKLKNILNVLEFLPYHINADTYRDQVDVLLISAKSKQRAEAAADKIEEQRQAHLIADKQLADDVRFRRTRILKLREEADDRYIAHEYDRAIDLYKIILKLDPRHKHAKQMVDLAESTMDIEDTIRVKSVKYQNRETRDLFDSEGYIIQDPHKAIIFPGNFSEFTRKRRFDLDKHKRSSEEDWKTNLRATLEKPASSTFDSQPLNQIIEKLMITYDVIINLDKEIDQEQVIDDIAVFNLNFRQVLEILVSKIEGGDELGWTLKYGTIFIGPSAGFKKESLIVNYDVRDLIAQIHDYEGPRISMVTSEAGGATVQEIETDEVPPSGDEFIELIQKATGDANWEDNHTMEYRNGSIVVNNTPEIQEKIEEILTSMRAQRNLQVTVLVRFLRLNIMDLDHIGFNYDGLATPPVSPWSSDVGLNNYPATDSVTTIGNNLGFISPTSGRDLLRGRMQNFLGQTYQIDNKNTTTALNEGAAFTFEYINDLQIAGLLRMVSTKRHANFLTAPLITCFNTQRANVTVLTQQAYIRDLTAVAQAGAALFDPEIGYIQTGTSLDVRPIVSHDRKFITLDLRPTDARLQRVDIVANNTAGTNSPNPNAPISSISGASQIELPVINFRALRATVSVPDRGSLLIGGFGTGQEVDDYNGIPFLSKIPVLNFLFGSTLRDKEQLNDYMLVKATIVSQSQIEKDLFGLD